MRTHACSVFLSSKASFPYGHCYRGNRGHVILFWCCCTLRVCGCAPFASVFGAVLVPFDLVHEAHDPHPHNRRPRHVPLPPPSFLLCMVHDYASLCSFALLLLLRVLVAPWFASDLIWLMPLWATRRAFTFFVFRCCWCPGARMRVSLPRSWATACFRVFFFFCFLSVLPSRPVLGVPPSSCARCRFRST